MTRVILFLLPVLACAQIPRVWDDTAMSDLEVPLARAEFSPKHATADFYYKIPVQPMWKTYPVYHPDHAPAGYMDWLKQQEPEQVWPVQRPWTDAEWIAAGELVFDSPIKIAPGGAVVGRPQGDPLYLTDRAWYTRIKPPITREGILPFYRYVIRKKGQIEVGTLSCGMCHTRVMPDGSIVEGAQGNFPFDQEMADDLRSQQKPTQFQLNLMRRLFFTPWMNEAQLALIADPAALDGRNPGSLTRHRSHPLYPIGIPDLIGLDKRRYLDRTGLQQNRGIADIMRYAALNQGGDDLSSFGGFVPAASAGRPVTPESQSRYSDEQLYALAKFLLSLRRPPNPNHFDAAARRGQVVFRTAGCAGCHAPPLYSNNKLTPAVGFQPPAEHRKKYDILDIVVGTDPGLAMETRRGTGYYKVPSLLGVWNRTALSHTGQVKSLEEWLDPQRLATNKGHEFGLQLSASDKQALIAFLRTL